MIQRLERRRYPRIQADVLLVGSIVGEHAIHVVQGYGELLCEGGVTAKLPTQLTPGDLICLELHIPNSKNQIIWTDAIVRHCYDGHHGLEFTSLGEKGRQAIKRFCKSRPRPKLLPGARLGKWQGNVQCGYCRKGMMYIGSGSYVCRTCLHWEYADGNGNGHSGGDGIAVRACNCRRCREAAPA